MQSSLSNGPGCPGRRPRLLAGGARGLQVTRTSLSHRSRGDAPAGGIAPSPAAELVNKMLVRPCVSPSDNGNHENRHRRPPQDAAQRRTEQHAVEPRAMRTSHHDQISITALSDLEYRAVGEAGRHLGVYIVRPEKRRLAAEAFRSRSLLSRKSSNHLPRPAAAVRSCAEAGR